MFLGFLWSKTNFTIFFRIFPFDVYESLWRHMEIDGAFLVDMQDTYTKYY